MFNGSILYLFCQMICPCGTANLLNVIWSLMLWLYAQCTRMQNNVYISELLLKMKKKRKKKKEQSIEALNVLFIIINNNNHFLSHIFEPFSLPFT